MSEYTALPWHVDKTLKRLIYDANGIGIGEVWHGVSDRDYEEEEANAEFIVLACNSHDEMVAALEAQFYTRPDGSTHIQACEEWAERCRHSCELARVALAKAKKAP